MRAVRFNEVRSSAVRAGPSPRPGPFGSGDGARAYEPAAAGGRPRSRSVAEPSSRPLQRDAAVRGAPEHGEHISYGRIETLSCRVFCERASINFGGGGRGRARPFAGVSLKSTSRVRRVALLRNGGEHIAPAHWSLGLLVRSLVVTIRVVNDALSVLLLLRGYRRKAGSPLFALRESGHYSAIWADDQVRSKGATEPAGSVHYGDRAAG